MAESPNDGRRADTDRQAGGVKHAADRPEAQLSQDQIRLISELAKHSEYENRSKWSTFLSLPAGARWVYFKEHFLVGTAIVAAFIALAAVIGFHVIARPPTPKLYVAGYNLPHRSNRCSGPLSMPTTSRTPVSWCSTAQCR